VIRLPLQLPIVWWYIHVFEKWYTAHNPLDLFPLEQWFPIFVVGFAIDFFVLYPLLQIVCFRLVAMERKNGNVSLPVKSIFSLGFRNIGKSFFSHLLLCTGYILLYLLIFFVIYTLGNGMFGQIPEAEEYIFWFAVGFGYFIANVTGIFLFIRFAVVIPIIETEPLGIFQAFRRSWALTRFSVWSIFGMLFAIFLVSLPFSFASMGLQQFLEGWIPFASDLFWEWVDQIMLLLVSPITLPIPCILFSIVYWNQRAIKEAYDLLRMIGGDDDYEESYRSKRKIATDFGRR
jgi:hypothetical protein